MDAAEQKRKKTAPKKRIAVMNFSANNSGADTARIARNTIELELFKTGLFDILEKEHINLIMAERKRQIAECHDRDCAVTIGKLLSAKYVILGSVDKDVSYVIQIKVVDVEKKRIVIADSTEASDIGKIRRAAERISRSISRRMERLDKAGETVVFSTAFNFLTPVDYLARKVGPGFGFTMTCMVEDLLVPGFQAGGAARFIYFTGKSHESHHAMMVPVNALAGYRFSIGDFSVNPVLGFGGSYNIVYYYRNRDSSDYSAHDAFQPILLFGLDLGYSFTHLFQLQLKPEYAIIFEQDGIVQFFSAGIGFSLFF
ncbi:MAG TPA: CsgG/HfaB family protein [Spirochaetota bacterium]|nr:CsgG/HfaB family protein [Spirochaetota bacterium]HPI90396.1 CsgG/HfaB family protein [Spirochaetota bacterium]HPR48521.1 CsgG/HfaB family protein [Spirochaetota bacterium]